MPRLFVFIVIISTAYVSFSFKYYKYHYTVKVAPLNSVIRNKWIREGVIESPAASEINQTTKSTHNNHFGEREEEIESSLYDSFTPSIDTSNKISVNFDEIDFSKIKPDDPIFLEMTWPTRPGPVATAFARHMKWKRQLSDTERLRWQKWAVYERLIEKETFDYTPEDYVFQNLLRDLEKRKFSYEKQSKIKDSLLWDEISYIYKRNEENQINSTIKALYTSFNNKNFDNVKTLWLPASNSELCLPGYERVVGYNEIEKFYRKFVADLKYIGSINHQIVSVDVYGYIAVVQTIETIEPGRNLRTARKKQKNVPTAYKVPTSNPTASRKVISTIVLRKWNKQWRIASQHSSPFIHSVYTNNPKPYIVKQTVVEDDSPVDKLVDKYKNIKKDLSVEKLKELKDTIIPKEFKGRLIRYHNDGPTYVNNNVTLDLTKAPTSWGKPIIDGDTIIFSRNYDNDDEIKIEDYINVDLSTSKQTILALRYLEKTEKITKNVKDILIMDIINCVAKEEISLVETSFEVLVLKANPSSITKHSSNNKVLNLIQQTNELRKNSIDVKYTTKELVIECLNEFAYQCNQIYQKILELNKNNKDIRNMFDIKINKSIKELMNNEDNNNKEKINNNDKNTKKLISIIKTKQLNNNNNNNHGKKFKINFKRKNK